MFTIRFSYINSHERYLLSHHKERTYLINSNSPSAGIKLMLRSDSNLLNFTHWWKVQSSIAIEGLTLERNDAINTFNATPYIRKGDNESIHSERWMRCKVTSVRLIPYISTVIRPSYHPGCPDNESIHEFLRLSWVAYRLGLHGQSESIYFSSIMFETWAIERSLHTKYLLQTASELCCTLFNFPPRHRIEKPARGLLMCVVNLVCGHDHNMISSMNCIHVP